jgi:hypothetical protein
VFALLGLAAFLVAAAVLVITALRHEKTTKRTTSTTTSTTPTRTAQPRPRPRKPVVTSVRLTAIGPYDPLGDDHENDEAASRATDGDPSTYWSTEHYNSWFKKGVGLVLDAGKPLRLTTVGVSTDTPGFAAEIRSGPNPKGPFARVSPTRTVGAATEFRLTEKTPTRYVLIWITRLGATPTTGGAAHVTEVKATASEQAKAPGR